MSCVLPLSDDDERVLAHIYGKPVLDGPAVMMSCLQNMISSLFIASLATYGALAPAASKVFQKRALHCLLAILCSCNVRVALLGNQALWHDTFCAQNQIAEGSSADCSFDLRTRQHILMQRLENIYESWILLYERFETRLTCLACICGVMVASPGAGRYTVTATNTIK